MTTQTLTEDELVRASTNAAETFTDAYYSALSSSRSTIASFYVPQTALATGRNLPLITYNGTQLSSPVDFAKIFTDQMPYTWYEVQSLNAHVLNPSITPLADAPASGRGRTKELEANISIMVQVSGYVRLNERKDGPMKGFSDTLVLVPNKEDVGGKGKAKSGEGRSWVIQTQNFRFVT